jgi:hypothetical protein
MGRAIARLYYSPPAPRRTALAAKINKHRDDYQDKPAAIDSVIIFQHRRHICQSGVRHEKEAEDGPESRVESRAEPVCEDRNDDHHESWKENREDRKKAWHGVIIAIASLFLLRALRAFVVNLYFAICRKGVYREDMKGAK